MLISGLQKLTLLDFPGRVACTVFLGGCDFRCPFCHNFDLATGRVPALMDDAQLLSFLRTRQGLLDGVAITGGEPCLSSGLADLIQRIRELHFAVKLDTNGNHPRRLRALMEEGLLSYVAMDIKNSPDKYARTCGLASMDLGPVRESISLLMKGMVPFEFRTTVVDELHAPEDFMAIGEWVHGAPLYYLQAFVDRESVPVNGLTPPSQYKMQQIADVLKPHVSQVLLK